MCFNVIDSLLDQGRSGEGSSVATDAVDVILGSETAILQVTSYLYCSVGGKYDNLNSLFLNKI